MRFFVLVSLLLLTVVATPIPSMIDSIKVSRSPGKRNPSASQILARYRCPPGSQPGSIHCPYTAAPLPRLEVSLQSKASHVLDERLCPPGVLHGSMECPYTASPPPYLTAPVKSKLNDNTGTEAHPKSTTNPKPSPKLDPIHDKLIIACGKTLQTCQICKSPHANCEDAQFEFNHDGGPQVCLKKEKLYCAPLPSSIWNSFHKSTTGI